MHILSTSILNDLPREILDEILAYTIPAIDVLGGSDTLPWSLMSVCKVWREAIASNPNIWEDIRVDFSPRASPRRSISLSDSGHSTENEDWITYSPRASPIKSISLSDLGHSTENEDWVINRIDTAFARAGGLLPSLTINVCESLETISTRIAERLCQHMHRVSVYTEMGSTGLFMGPTLLRTLDAADRTLVNLRCLQFIRLSVPAPALFPDQERQPITLLKTQLNRYATKFPNLKAIHFDMHWGSVRPGHPEVMLNGDPHLSRDSEVATFDMRNITSLTLAGQGCTRWTHLADVLPQVPLLARLILRGNIFSPVQHNSNEESQRSHFHLPHLRVFGLYTHDRACLNGVLSLFGAPRLERLYIEANWATSGFTRPDYRPEVDSILKFVERSGICNSLAELELSGKELDTLPLAPLFRELYGLKRLKMDIIHPITIEEMRGDSDNLILPSLEILEARMPRSVDAQCLFMKATEDRLRRRSPLRKLVFLYPSRLRPEYRMMLWEFCCRWPRLELTFVGKVEEYWGEHYY